MYVTSPIGAQSYTAAAQQRMLATCSRHTAAGSSKTGAEISLTSFLGEYGAITRSLFDKLVNSSSRIRS